MSSLVKVAVLALVVAQVPVPSLAGCSAQSACSSGPPVTCTGQNVCEVVAGGVRCDGIFSGCSSPVGDYHCNVSYECPSPPFSSRWYIACSSSEYCSSDPFGHSITCGWQTITCQECEDAYLYNYGYICWQLP
jgi:hypothetical protein